MSLTKRQKEFVDYIRDYIDQRGYAPTLEELAEHFDLASKATVHKHLSNLEEKGVIKREWNLSRSIELVEEDDDVWHNEVEVPLLGYVAAGYPIMGVANPETIAIPRELLGRNRTYVLRVRGDSMIDDHIRDGDLIIVEECDAADDGETVVALINHEDVTMKRYYREGEMIRLQPANEQFKPIYVKEDELTIQGRVIGLLRKY